MKTMTELLAELPGDASPAQAADRLRTLFEAQANPDDSAGVAHFMPGVDRTYGLRVPVVRALAKEAARFYGKAIEPCTALARVCWTAGSREHRLFAVFLLEPLKLSPAECWTLGRDFLPGVITWEDCDQLCASTTGRALAADPGIMDALEGWARAENFWFRRAALVSTVYLRRSRLPEATLRVLDERTLALAATLLDDPEDYVRKAVDWAVREVLGRHADLGRAWLLAQAAAGPSRRARAVLKLSAKKLSPADQAAFLAALG